MKFHSLKNTNQTYSIIGLIRLIILFLFFAGCRKAELTSITSKSTTGVALNATSRKPNIILVLADDLGYEIPTCDGGQSYSTTNIDRMSRQGLRFTRCHSSPLCSPSRFMLLTGKYNFRNYYTNSWGTMDTSQRTIADIMKAAGYATCAAGKWQLDGGDTSIRIFGFDNYMVTKPYKESGVGEDFDIFYKNPKIYTKGAYLSSSETLGKYGEECAAIMYLNLLTQIRINHSFIYWATNLPHKPFSPTPDDAAFATWDPLRLQEKGDTIYYPSMVKYLDKEIGMLYDKLGSMQLDKNTILIFTGDNGTDGSIHSLFKGKSIQGGKAYPIENGIHVPVIIDWQGTILPRTLNNSLISFTDFMPTIAALAQTTVPSSYGIIDGVSFQPQIYRNFSTQRSWLYTYYDPNRYGEDGRAPSMWAQDTMYKFLRLGQFTL